MCSQNVRPNFDCLRPKCAPKFFTVKTCVLDTKLVHIAFQKDPFKIWAHILGAHFGALIRRTIRRTAWWQSNDTRARFRRSLPAPNVKVFIEIPRNSCPGIFLDISWNSLAFLRITQHSGAPVCPKSCAHSRSTFSEHTSVPFWTQFSAQVHIISVHIFGAHL